MLITSARFLALMMVFMGVSLGAASVLAAGINELLERSQERAHARPRTHGGGPAH